MDTAFDRPAPSPRGAHGSTRFLALRIVALAAVAFTVGNATWAAWDQGTTYDEPFHLRWPERLLDERNDARDEFRFDSKTPALLPAVLIRKGVSRIGVQSDQLLRFSSRIPSVALLGALLLLVARLARTDDPATWWTGLLLAALDPNLAAHASIATTDLAYTAVVLALSGALAFLRPSLGRAFVIGMIIGLAFAVKYAAVLALPVAGIALALPREGSLRRRLAQATVAATAACLTMSVLYLWVGVFQPLGGLLLQTPLLKSVASTLPSLPLPIPRSVITGIDASMAHNDATYWASYLFGADHRGGIWYYFIANWFMKTPVALIPIIVFGLWRLLSGWRNPAVITMGALFVIHLGYFSFLFPTQIGLRFALPCVALGCALAARGLRGLGSGWLIAAALLALAERAPYWGDPIAFTNLSVWPKSRAYWHTADSNLDYGQNRGRLPRYARETGLSLVMDQATVTPGNYVVGTNELVIFGTRRSHRWLVENNIPAINVGFTHFAFAVTGDRFEDYMNAARIAPALVAPDQACAGPLPHYRPGSQIPFEQTVNPERGRLFVVCATSRKGVDLGFRVTAGRVWFGRVSDDGVCEADLLQSGQQAWFRIRGGAEARLCLKEIPLRRPYLRYATIGYLTVRAQGAEVEFRQLRVDSLGLNQAGPAESK